MADRRRLLWLKGLVIVYGAMSIALGFCAPYAGPLLQVSIIILGVIGGPILAVFTLGILVPYVNQKVSNDTKVVISAKNNNNYIGNELNTHYYFLFYTTLIRLKIHFISVWIRTVNFYFIFFYKFALSQDFFTIFFFIPIFNFYYYYFFFNHIV